MKRRHGLRGLYDQLPPVPCDPDCTECCRPTPFCLSELGRVADRIPPQAIVKPHIDWGTVYTDPATTMEYANRGTWPTMDGMWSIAVQTHEADSRGRRMKCAFAKDGGGCSIHEDRPLVCRLYGTYPQPEFEDGSGCPRGKLPLVPLTLKRAMAIMKAYMRIAARQASDM